MKHSLWDKKKKKARQQLVDTAYRLFEKNGFEQTTVDEITEAAEISRSTFFRYFASKDAVAFPYQQQRIEKLEGLIAGYRREHSPLEAVKRGLLDMARYYKNIRAELNAQRRIIDSSPRLKLAQMDFDSQWEEIITGQLSAAAAKNEQSKRQAQMLGGMIFGLIMAILRDWYAGECKKDLLRMGREAFDMLEAGALKTEFSGAAPDRTKP